MLMIIAGAGASFDSVPFEPPYAEAEGYRLPLANELFGVSRAFLDIQAQYPDLRQVWSRLQQRPIDRTVEDVLAELQQEAGHNPDRHRQLVAVRYYLQALIHKCEQQWYRGHPVPTNMAALFDEIENARRLRDGREHPVFVTFNYDRLIENALINRGHQFADTSSYVAPVGPSLFKLHGSVDWVRPVELRVPPSNASREAVALRVAEEWSVLRPECIGEIMIASGIKGMLSEEGAHLPAIAIPTRGKKFECPDSHLVRLRHLLPRVRCILTIGWRAEETHFMEELQRHVTGRIEGICVGKDEADATPIARRLNASLRAHFTPFDGAGFSDFIHQRGVERLLNLAWNE